MASRFARTTVTYFVGTLLSKVVGIVLLPIYTAAIIPSDFGEFDFWTNLVTFLAPIAFMQCWDAAYRLHFSEDGNAPVVASSAAAFMCGGVIIYSATIVPLLLLADAPNAGLIAAYGFALVCQYFLGYLARSELRNSLFVLSGIANTLMTATVSVGLLRLEWGTAALVTGLVAGSLLQCLVLMSALRPWQVISRADVDMGVVRRVLVFAGPLSLTSASYWLLTGWTRLSVLGALGPSDAGLLAVGFRFGMVVAAVTSVLVYAWNELLFTSTDDRVQAVGGRVMVTAGLLGTAAAVLASHMAFDILIAPEYAAGRRLVPLIILATGFNSIATLLASIFMALNDTRPLLWSTSAAAVLNVAAGTAVVQWGGVAWAAVVLAAAFGTMLVWRVVVLTRRFAVKVVGRAMLMPSLALTAALAVTLAEGGTVALAGSLALLLAAAALSVRSARG